MARVRVRHVDLPNRFEQAPLGRLVMGVLVMVALTVAGTLGFRWLAGLGWIDAAYMAVTTLSTVGFGEIVPLDATARAFTTVYIMIGVGAALYTASALAEFLIAGRIGEMLGRRAMNRELAALRDHVIVCGFGRFGRSVSAELDRVGVPQVIIEEDDTVVERLENARHAVIHASAADEGVLAEAGIDRARAIVIGTGSEAVNAFIALAAREASETLAIHARAETDAGARHLRRAGAYQVVLPYELGGQRVAHAILRPAVVSFIELSAAGTGAEIDLEEVVIDAASPLAGRPIGELGARDVHVSVVAIKRRGGPLGLNPLPDAIFEAGDEVVVVGDRANVSRLGELAGVPGAQRREA